MFVAKAYQQVLAPLGAILFDLINSLPSFRFPAQSGNKPAGREIGKKGKCKTVAGRGLAGLRAREVAFVRLNCRADECDFK